MRMTRPEARALRSGLDPALRRIWSGAIVEHALAWDVFRKARAVIAYAPVGSEPEIWPLLRRTLALGKRLLLPRCAGSGNMVAMEVSDLACLVPGAFGILEPAGDSRPMGKGSIDLCLTPGLLYDLQCNRLGQGGGYYDRFLKGFSGVSCGVAFAAQVVEALEVRPHDMPVNALVTERGVYYKP